MSFNQSQYLLQSLHSLHYETSKNLLFCIEHAYLQVHIPRVPLVLFSFCRIYVYFFIILCDGPSLKPLSSSPSLLIFLHSICSRLLTLREREAEG